MPDFYPGWPMTRRVSGPKSRVYPDKQHRDFDPELKPIRSQKSKAGDGGPAFARSYGAASEGEGLTGLKKRSMFLALPSNPI